MDSMTVATTAPKNIKTVRAVQSNETKAQNDDDIQGSSNFLPTAYFNTNETENDQSKLVKTKVTMELEANSEQIEPLLQRIRFMHITNTSNQSISPNQANNASVSDNKLVLYTQKESSNAIQKSTCHSPKLYEQFFDELQKDLEDPKILKMTEEARKVHLESIKHRAILLQLDINKQMTQRAALQMKLLELSKSYGKPNEDNLAIERQPVLQEQLRLLEIQRRIQNVIVNNADPEKYNATLLTQRIPRLITAPPVTTSTTLTSIPAITTSTALASIATETSVTLTSMLANQQQTGNSQRAKL